MSKLRKFGLIAVMAMLVSAVAASAAMATTATPAGEAFTASLKSSSITFKTGVGTTTCTGLESGGTVPASPGNVNPTGAVTTNLVKPTFTGCTTTVFEIPGATTTTVTTNDQWQVEVESLLGGPPPVARIIAPNNGMIVKVVVLGGAATCVAEGRGEGFKLAGAWENGSPTSVIHLKENGVPVKVTGTGLLGGLCNEPVATAEITADLAVDGVSNPIQVTE